MNENVMIEIGYIENNKIQSVVTDDYRKIGEVIAHCARRKGVPYEGHFTNIYDVGIVYWKIYEKDDPESKNELIFL